MSGGSKTVKLEENKLIKYWRAGGNRHWIIICESIITSHTFYTNLIISFTVDVKASIIAAIPNGWQEVRGETVDYKHNTRVLLVEDKHIVPVTADLSSMKQERRRICLLMNKTCVSYTIDKITIHWHAFPFFVPLSCSYIQRVRASDKLPDHPLP